MTKKTKLLYILLISVISFNKPFNNQAQKIDNYSNLFTEKDSLYQIEISNTKNKFHKVNNTVSDSFVIVFNSVLKTFDLEKNKDLFIAQILVESKACQFYPDGHKNAGKVLTGSSGEKGICQILPGAAFNIMKLISYEDKKKMILLGATDFSNIKTIEQTKIWLSNTNNNIILYGFIMRYFMNYYNNNVKKSVVAYNTGQPGLKQYLDTGATVEKHHYYKALSLMKSKL